MGEKKQAPAILIFKGKSGILEDLSEHEEAELLKALFFYGDDKPVPKLSKTVSIIFKFIKAEIDENERKYNEKVMASKISQQKWRDKQKQAQIAQSDESSKTEPEQQPKPRGKPAREPTEEKVKTVRQSKLTDLQARFLNAFKAHLPDKAINCKLADFPDVDLEALMFAIKQSPQYLMNPEKNKSFNGLRWYMEHAKNIIAGNYRKYSDSEPLVITDGNKQTSKLTGRTYTKEEMNSLFQSVDEIEI